MITGVFLIMQGMVGIVLSGLIRLESVIKVIGEKFSGKVAHGNIAAATEAYDLIKTRTKEVSIHA